MNLIFNLWRGTEVTLLIISSRYMDDQFKYKNILTLSVKYILLIDFLSQIRYLFDLRL